MSKEFNIEDYIQPVTTPLPDLIKRLRSERLGVGKLTGGFIPPMPAQWFFAACDISDAKRSTKAVRVGAILWQQLKMKKTQPLRISQTVWQKFRLERRAVLRALKALEDGGLITVQRFKHRSPEITIKPVTPVDTVI